MTGILITAIGSVFFSSGAAVGGQPFWPLAVTGAKADDEGVGHGNPAVPTRQGRATPVRSRSESSGAAGTAIPSADSRAQVLTSRVTAPVCPPGSIRAGKGCIDRHPVALVRCPSVRKALHFYTARWKHWAQLRGVPALLRSPARLAGCPTYLLHIRQRKATAAHREWNRWFHYQYVWSDWLPDKWARIGACETGYGRRPGNWRHSNSSYEGAFGFAKSSWDSFKYRADPKAGPYPEDAWQATPRQQYEVALAIYRAYGFSGWGCRGA